MSASRVFDLEDQQDRAKLKEVARNVERKRLRLEQMPFILDATRNDAKLMASCQLPRFDQICPLPKTKTKRQHFDTTEEST